MPDDTLAEQVETWLDTPTTGGTAIDAAGTIYLGDVGQRRILTITPDGQVDTLLTDPRLIWADARWIDRSGHLWIPAAQLNRTQDWPMEHSRSTTPSGYTTCRSMPPRPARDHT
ncbi:hypothetical protein V6U90_30110 [Micromonospora sp. CPCC 206060]|uniref:hypothetical protein n=1 Tax=Micromonospora sp. CPCC 206060 TaxID=3122406 RepID=UPI002FF1705A